MRRKQLQWISGLALAGTVLAGSGPGWAQTTVKIGIVNSFSGFLAATSDEMQKGMDLYAKTHLKDLPPNVSVDIIKRDDGTNPETGKRGAQELITHEKVQILLGVMGSPVAAAIAPLTAEAKIPIVLANAGGAAIPRISPYIVRVSFTLWQTSLPLGKWATSQGLKKAYTLVSDFIPGHDAEAAFTKGFTDGGGQILGAVRVPPNNPDFAPFVQKAKDAKPDTLFVFLPGGPQSTAMMKAIKDLGLVAAGIKIAATQDLVPDEELTNMGDAPIGVITTGNYSVAGVRPANTVFLATWLKEYGEKSIPDFFAVAGWDGMAAVFDVIKHTKGTLTGDEAMAILKTWKNPDNPRGPIAIAPVTRDIIQNIYIRRVELKDGKLVNSEFDTIPDVNDPWQELNPLK